MPSSDGRTVLVVEDDQAVRTFVRFALERGKLSVVEVDNGADALRVAAAGGVDAVLVDGLLPDMHGVALATALLNQPATAPLPICFLTGAVHSRGRGGAGIGCLVKPVRPGDLVEQLESLLSWAASGGSPFEDRRRALARLESGFLVGP